MALWRIRPDELVQRLRLAQRNRRTGVRDRGLDLAPVADDPRVREQALDVSLSELRHPVGREPSEGRPERLALPQDRQPGEARLEPLEAQPLVEPLLVPDRATPLLVVVGEVPGVRGLPAAVYATSTRTRPSSTTTGYVSTGS
jgi:hypothetical protein